MTKLLLEHLSPSRRKDVLPLVLQRCRVANTMPRILFHVVWTSLFSWLEAECEQGAAAAFKAVEEDHLQAAWRSAPDRVMPGTDVGSAPQESWRKNTLKDALRYSWKQPYTLAQALKQDRLKTAANNPGDGFFPAEDLPRLAQHWSLRYASLTSTPSKMTPPLQRRDVHKDKTQVCPVEIYTKSRFPFVNMTKILVSYEKQ